MTGNMVEAIVEATCALKPGRIEVHSFSNLAELRCARRAISAQSDGRVTPVQ